LQAKKAEKMTETPRNRVSKPQGDSKGSNRGRRAKGKIEYEKVRGKKRQKWGNLSREPGIMPLALLHRKTEKPQI